MYSKADDGVYLFMRNGSSSAIRQNKQSGTYCEAYKKDHITKELTTDQNRLTSNSKRTSMYVCYSESRKVVLT